MFKTVRCDNGKRGWGRDKGEGEVVDQSRSLGGGGCVCKLFMTMSAAWRVPLPGIPLAADWS